MQWLVAIAAPLLPTSCILTPAKFVSTLDIRADRSFTFIYVGKVQLAKTRSTSGLSDTSRGDAQSWEEEGEKRPALFKSGYSAGSKPQPMATCKWRFPALPVLTCLE